MDRNTRRRFDTILEEVLDQLPQWIHDLIDEVPLHVEDYPSDELLHQMNIAHRGQLCGLYTGIPLTDRSIRQSGTMPDVVTIYREGVINAAANAHGMVTDNRLRREIRITLLHELGHHHGLDEDDLRELGYG
ncbi:MAG: metallopeptidase family protein [Pirellulales bacterium]|nr:metallopeptidase family protein [Pirellulales bacterium]